MRPTMEAYVVFMKLNGFEDNSATWRLYKRFLGLSEDQLIYHLSEEAKIKINWLLGPHARTMYKIWEAQHEKELTS